MLNFMWSIAGGLLCLILILCLALISVGMIGFCLVVGRNIYREVKGKGWNQVIDDFENRIAD